MGEGGGGASVPLDIDASQQSSIISLSSMSESETAQEELVRSQGGDECLGQDACAGDKLPPLLDRLCNLIRHLH